MKLSLVIWLISDTVFQIILSNHVFLFKCTCATHKVISDTEYVFHEMA